MLGSGDVPRVLHRVDHVRELGAADKQLNEVGSVAFVDRDEQLRCAALRDQALLLSDRELCAIRSKLLLGGRELDLCPVPRVDERTEAGVEGVHLCENVRSLGVLRLDLGRGRSRRAGGGVREPHERECSESGDSSPHPTAFGGGRSAPVCGQHFEATGPPASETLTRSLRANASSRAR